MSLRAAILAALAILAIVLIGVWQFEPSTLAEARALLDRERLEMIVARAGFWGPVLIVALMTVAVVALFADGPSVLRNIGGWRVKETDRIAAMAAELAKLGAGVEAGRDYLRIVPPSVVRAATIETYDDHRMAMSFSLAACGGVGVRINDPGCVAKTFPDYFARLAALTRR